MKCTQCGREFEISEVDERRGRGKYCGRECFYKSRSGRKRPELYKRIKRNCAMCGREFETGGRLGPIDKVFCSRTCQAHARVHTASINQLSPTDAAYLAGLMDGEGSIVAAMKREKRTTWRIQVSNTDFALLQWCMDAAGCGSIVHHKHNNHKWAESGWWQCYSWNARDIMMQILPYMKIAEKIRRANLLIDELDAIERLTLSAGG